MLEEIQRILTFRRGNTKRQFYHQFRRQKFSSQFFSCFVFEPELTLQVINYKLEAADKVLSSQLRIKKKLIVFVSRRNHSLTEGDYSKLFVGSHFGENFRQILEKVFCKEILLFLSFFFFVIRYSRRQHGGKPSKESFMCKFSSLERPTPLALCWRITSISFKILLHNRQIRPTHTHYRGKCNIC